MCTALEQAGTKEPSPLRTDEPVAVLEGPLKKSEGVFVYRCVTPGIITAAMLVQLAQEALDRLRN